MIERLQLERFVRLHSLDASRILDILLDAVWHSEEFNRVAYILLYNASMHLQGLPEKVKPHDWEPERWV